MAAIYSRYDLIVVGGGPAGSSAALHAARHGANVLVLEKRPMPRPKLCGGWVSTRAQQYLGLEIPDGIINHPFTHLELRCGSVGSRFFPSQPLGVFVDRAIFDEFLLRQAEQAGAAIKFERATAIHSAGDHVEVETRHGKYPAHGAVICTGAAGTLSTVVRPADPPGKSGVCLEQRLPSNYANLLQIDPGTARLFFGDIPFGYGWVLHHGTHILVGVGCRRTCSQNPRLFFDAHWRNLGLPEELRAPVGHPIPIGGYRRVLGRGRRLLAGDAAAFVDAFTGEGIACAVRSGQLAVQALLDGTHASPTALYTRLCRKEILRPLRQSRWAAQVFYRLPRRQLARLCGNPYVAEEYCAVLHGERSYLRFAAGLLMPAMPMS